MDLIPRHKCFFVGPELKAQCHADQLAFARIGKLDIGALGHLIATTDIS